ncbi:hypothetical protein D3C76_699680 [compost metagenome]
MGGLGHFSNIKWLADFIIQPLLQLRVAGVTLYFRVDQLFFLRVDAAVCLGCRNQCSQDRMAVVLGLGAGQLIDST